MISIIIVDDQISSALFIGEGTVRNYISVIYSKIGTNDRPAAIGILRDLLLEDDD